MLWREIKREGLLSLRYLIDPMKSFTQARTDLYEKEGSTREVRLSMIEGLERPDEIGHSR
ncbi:hypothetical protein KTT_24690 [Tengunoibacter tsumagoiensis]|uniref:Uncharacterized protein n=1 Tax=Tengunoibacter tsumagoiensis TaxID=2014871 RepID=A0A402A0D6_9CHLR|nr:hypothetical protein KTT_24690 [Tengunoibacter tsumagoiensis]